MKTFTALAGAFVLASCSTNDSPNVSASDVAALNQAALGVSASVASYRTPAASMVTSADCAAALQQYSEQVQPEVNRIAQMSGRMDGAMSAMGEGMGADMECGAGVMQQELAQYLGAACTAPDMAANRAQAERHCNAMQDLADHMQMRAHQMDTMAGSNGGMMGGGMGTGGGMGMGGGSMEPAMMDGGWTKPDGGMIPFGHTMPGCADGDGGFQPNGGALPDGAAQ
jgi:hypothetical protein